VRPSGALPAPLLTLIPVPVLITLGLLAAALALLVYALAQRLPLRPGRAPAPQVDLVSPLDQSLTLLLERAGLALRPRQLIDLILLMTGLGALAASRSGEGDLLLLMGGALMAGSIPYLWVRGLVRARCHAMDRALSPALGHLRNLCAVRGDPLLALVDALPSLAKPLQGAVGGALVAAEAGTPFPLALREEAIRWGGNAGLYQLAELITHYDRSSGGLSEGLGRLGERLQGRVSCTAVLPSLVGALPMGLPLAAAVLLPGPQLPLVSPEPFYAARLTVLLLATALGLAVYGVARSLARDSPRQSMPRRLGATPVPGPTARLVAAFRTRWRQPRLTQAYPDLVFHLLIMTEAGRSLSEGFASSPPILSEPLRSEVGALVGDLRRLPESNALQAFAERCSHPLIDFLAHRLIRDQSVGVPLPQILAAEAAVLKCRPVG
jgi:hypothetical protein